MFDQTHLLFSSSAHEISLYALVSSWEAQKACLKTALWRRFDDNAMPFDGLSALTQLTHFASDYASSMQRQKLCNELAHLTRLKKLNAPVALQSEGEGCKAGVATCTSMHDCDATLPPQRVTFERNPECQIHTASAGKQPDTRMSGCLRLLHALL